MRYLPLRSLVCSSVLLLGLTASLNAQQYPPRSDDRYQDRDEQRSWTTGRTFDRIRADLDRARADAIPLSGDRFRLYRAKDRVNEFQNDWAAGNFDRRELDEAISALQQVVDHNRLSDLDRDRLTADLGRLHELRQWREGER
jgi:hypothetical protein